MKSWLSRWTGRPSAPELQAAPPRPSADALIAEGHQLEDAGDLAGALACYRQAGLVAPNAAPPRINEGIALQALGDNEAAIVCYRQALACDAASAAAWLNLGNALMSRISRDRAEREPWLVEAEAAYRSALQLKPDWATAWFGLGCALEAQQAFDEACAAYRRALVLDPKMGSAEFNLYDLQAEQLVKNNAVATARQMLHEAIERHPQQTRLLARLADLERECGQVEKGLALLDRLLALNPGDFSVGSVRLFALNFLPVINRDALFEAHRTFGRQLEATVPSPMGHPPRSSGQRLKIGYVSPDFRRHPVAVFMLPVLRGHDRGCFKVYGYNNFRDGDEVTEALMAACDHWRDVAGLDDAGLDRIIREDGIDILVDLAGHTSGGRMAVFARKPAPLQMTWLGYLGSTGLSRIDYRICDAHTDPIGVAEAYHTERLLRLPDTQWCYESALPPQPATPLPYSKNGYWTFGSFNNTTKLNAQIFAAWAAVLLAIPGSRLRLFGMTNPDVRKQAREAFAFYRIGSERVDLVERLPLEQYFASFGTVDVALDSFPYSGGTTTCDTLLMGVPVVTIAGDRTLARSGVSLLSCLGLQDWIAESPETLPVLLQRQLADATAVAALRKALPGRMQASALMDAARFVRHLEQGYLDAWRGAGLSTD